jgi:DNA-binding MarR family transcriptional regulator
MKSTQETTFNLLSQVTELWQAEVKAELNKYSLTILEFTVLSSIVHLAQNNNEIIQTAVSTYTQLKPMNMSILLRKLQARNFIQRQEHSIDTRAKTITLTPLGKETVVKITFKINEIMAMFFQLSKSQEVAFTNKLQQIRDSKLV